MKILVDVLTWIYIAIIGIGCLVGFLVVMLVGFAFLTMSLWRMRNVIWRFLRIGLMPNWYWDWKLSQCRDIEDYLDLLKISPETFRDEIQIAAQDEIERMMVDKP